MCDLYNYDELIILRFQGLYAVLHCMLMNRANYAKIMLIIACVINTDLCSLISRCFVIFPSI